MKILPPCRNAKGCFFSLYAVVKFVFQRLIVGTLKFLTFFFFFFFVGKNKIFVCTFVDDFILYEYYSYITMYTYIINCVCVYLYLQSSRATNRKLG